MALWYQLYRKDARLPEQLQRAMAAEAEASREARAKVIAADGEKRASKALREASQVIEESPNALQLRYLQVSYLFCQSWLPSITLEIYSSASAEAFYLRKWFLYWCKNRLSNCLYERWIFYFIDNDRPSLFLQSIEIWPARKSRVANTAWNQSLDNSLHKRVSMVLFCYRPFCTALVICCMLSIRKPQH